MQNVLTKVLKGVAAAMLLALVIGLSAFAWMLYRYDFRLLGVQTGSMSPALGVGDGLLSRPVQLADVDTGEVITYKSSAGHLVTHRVIQVDRRAATLVTKGDANRSADAPIRSEQIVSQPLAIVPYAGDVVSLTRRPLVMLGLAYALTIGLIGQEMVRYARSAKPVYRLPGY